MAEYKVTSIGVYDEREVHTNCTVEILRNSITGEKSVGWWDNDKPPMRIGEDNGTD